MRRCGRGLLAVFEKRLAEAQLPQTVYFGEIVTGESFIEHEGRELINQRFKPLCADMETAAVAHVCYVNKIPFAAVRSISDTEENSGQENFAKYCDLASRNSFKVVELLSKSRGEW
ncbi:MAG: 5'-methylthioadenosine/S-adenosylhomocysteine nucleosidase [Firmicutes bacterium]|nr:5'-methylthioadenosine/S-adenosylhomocysteine nucleosidase [Bacillota bacterium]